MWVVDFTVARHGVPTSKTCGFYTKYALIEFIGKLVQRDSTLSFNIHYDAEFGKRGDKQ